MRIQSCLSIAAIALLALTGCSVSEPEPVKTAVTDAVVLSRTIDCMKDLGYDVSVAEDGVGIDGELSAGQTAEQANADRIACRTTASE